MQLQQHRQILANGLRVQLHHSPHLKQAAAWLRVNAGSHDVPGSWPGLAHFLEHLFFLGTERFSADQALMPFVQQHGGQLNASTRERCTDYFLELPAPAFAAGLERLVDMLGNLRMTMPEQWREREVLHAEFIAWSRSARAREEIELTAPLNPAHPIRAFHAGNRYTLPVPRPAFQQALRAFYSRYYQTGQMTLCLVGPHPLPTLLAMAEQTSALLRPGPGVAQRPPPELSGQAHGTPLAADMGKLTLVFACEQLPPGLPLALDFLATGIASTHAGGLLAELRQRGWVQTLRLTPHYQFAGQALITLDIALNERSPYVAGQVAAWCFDWLRHFAAGEDWAVLREEFALLRQRQRQMASALELARQFIDEPGHDDLRDSLPALRAVLAQLCPQRLINSVAAVDVPAPAPHWQAPPRNRFLCTSPSGRHLVALPAALTCWPGPDSPLASVRLRWRHADGGPDHLWQSCNLALQDIAGEAEQAGVKLTWARLGSDWTLHLCGVADALAAVLEHALLALPMFAADICSQAQEAEPALIPIRALLKQLPEYCLGKSSEHRILAEPTSTAQADAWRHARWEGLAVGLTASLKASLGALLLKAPGTAAEHSAVPLAPWPGSRRYTLATAPGEQALLLFCPVVGNTLGDEAAWRLLAQLAQRPFYQRLRVELQLGYAVFSDWRQIGGQAGILFGVQSPSITVDGLLAHIDTFIHGLPAHVAALETAQLLASTKNLAGALVLADMPTAKAAEWLWQARLAGRDYEYVRQMPAAVSELTPDALLAAAQAMAANSAPRLLLATTDA